MSVLTGNNPFYRNIDEKVKIEIDGEGDAKKNVSSAKKSTNKGGATNTAKKAGDAKKPAKDATASKTSEGEKSEKDEKSDAKDFRIQELEKDYRIRELEKGIEDLDDPLPEVEPAKAPSKMRVKDRGDSYHVINDEGKTVKKFDYDNKKRMSKWARWDAQRHAEGEYNKKMKEAGLKEETIEEKVKPQKITKLNASVINTLKQLDAEEAKLIIQGLPRNLQKQALKAVGIKESELAPSKIDGRTKGYRETAQRLLDRKKISEVKKGEKVTIDGEEYEVTGIDEKKLKKMTLQILETNTS